MQFLRCYSYQKQARARGRAMLSLAALDALCAGRTLRSTPVRRRLD